MPEFKIGNVYRRKGFHYKVLDERPLDDTFTQYLLGGPILSLLFPVIVFELFSQFLPSIVPARSIS